MDALFGLILLLIFGVVTWCVASEGAWGACLTFLCVLLSGLMAMNFFEPVASIIENNGGNFLRPYADVAALLGLFALFTFLSRSATDHLSPTDIELDGRVYQVTRWLFALATGYTTMAISLTAVHTSPLPREFIGFRPEARNLFDVAAPDRQWLGFVQHVSERVLRADRIFDGPIATFPETDQRVWPSFPIRYATRRDELGTATSGKLPGQSSGSVGGGSTSGGAPPAGGAPSF
jgi:hypothetical protein